MVNTNGALVIMRDLNEYINKVNQIAKSEENVKFLPVTKAQLNIEPELMHSDLDDYKEIKDIVREFEQGMSVSNKKVAPVVVPVRDGRQK